MGIQGLLPLIKEALQPKTLEAYRGQTVAVDAYVWLHRGVYTCAQELALGAHSNRYVNYCMGRVRMLQAFGVKPYIVFDGSPLPSKRGTEGARAARRADALQRANSYLAAGKTDSARDEFAKAVDVTPAMAYQFIKALRAANIPFVVAPFEADAQLAYLERKGIVDAIISEDSDLVVFGCSTVLFKLDQAGALVEYKRDRLTACTEHRFHGWTEERFRQMAIISGCDYLDGLGGLGIKGAHQLFYKYKSAHKVIEQVRLAGKVKVPKNYIGDFQRANLTFVYQRVFDPVTEEAVHLNPLPPKGLPDAIFEAVGGRMTTELAFGIARGDLDPATNQPMIDIGLAETPAGQLEAGPSRLTKTSSGSFYKPKERRVTASNGPLDAFFSRKPAPAVRSSPKKVLQQQPKSRPALGIVRNNAREHEALPMVASKFFGGQLLPGTEVAVFDDEGVDQAGVDVLMELETSNATERPPETEAKEGLADSVVSLGLTSEPAEDLPTSEMMLTASPPSKRKRRRLIEAEELMDVKSSPSSVKTESDLRKQDSGSPAYFASPISSPAREAELGTPTKKVIATWHHLFKRSSSDQHAIGLASGLPSTSKREISSPLRPSSSMTFNGQTSPHQEMIKMPPRAKTAAPLNAPYQTDRAVGTVTSRAKPLSSFMYKRPRT